MLQRQSEAHIRKWTVEETQCDWKGYREASRAVTRQISKCVETDWELLIQLLGVISDQLRLGLFGNARPGG